MLSLLLLAAAMQPSLSPETEAVMGPRKAPDARRVQRETRAPVGAPVGAPAIAPRLTACIDAAEQSASAGIGRARNWIAEVPGDADGWHCLGYAQAQAGDYRAAADAFERGAAVASAETAGRLWAQAGNAALAGGDAGRSVAALDRALAVPSFSGFARGQALLDRARGRVALGDLAPARADLDAALPLVSADPLAWLLSATLARRMEDLPLARAHIAEAARRSPDDASVSLEQGLIAALAGDDADARRAFDRVRMLAPGSGQALAATDYLRQLNDPAGAARDQSR